MGGLNPTKELQKNDLKYCANECMSKNVLNGVKSVFLGIRKSFFLYLYN